MHITRHRELFLFFRRQNGRYPHRRSKQAFCDVITVLIYMWREGNVEKVGVRHSTPEGEKQEMEGGRKRVAQLHFRTI